MSKLLALFGVVFCVLGGYVLNNGHLGVLWQPFEFMIIFGAAVMAYIIANPMHVVKHTGHELKMIFKPPTYQKKEYLELLSLLCLVFKTARQKGWLAMERHIEAPKDSELFNQFPGFMKNQRLVTFLCDYLRLISLGSDKPHEIEALMDQEIETEREERSHVSHGLQQMADGMPALGIVAAVLGVIHTMGSITEPPEVLGHLIGGALVGTFLGVLLSYGFVGPLGAAVKNRNDTEMRYVQCMKVSLLAFLQGAAPQVAIEFGRKILAEDVQPTFLEVEEATQDLTAVK